MNGAAVLGQRYYSGLPIMPDVKIESSVDLLLKAQSGDQEALDLLLARYLPRLQRWASGRLPVSAREMFDTGDLVQDAVINALRHLNTLEIRHEGTVQAYLRSVVNNRIIDLYRRGERQPQREEFPENAAAQNTSPLEAAIGAEAIERYERALQRLRDEDREAIILRVELGFDSWDEVAVQLGKPSAAAARMAVKRAIARLAEEMSHDK